MDNCGVARSVNCGDCTGGKGCVVGVCKTPACSTFTYTRANLTALTQNGIEDSMGGASPDGKTILYIKTNGVSAACGAYRLIVADETGVGTYNQQDITTTLTAAGLFVGQDGYAITADRLTIITTTTNRKQLATIKRSAASVVDFGAPSMTDFAAISIPAADAGQIVAPNISADGLEFFYTVVGYPTNDARNGIFNSVRTSTSVPFPAGTRMPAPVNDPAHGPLTGVSSDRLAVFVFYGYQTRVFTRTSTSKPFVNPTPAGNPPQIEGWSHKPLADCATLVGMYSPGGCQNEDIVTMTRQ